MYMVRASALSILAQRRALNHWLRYILSTCVRSLHRTCACAMAVKCQCCAVLRIATTCGRSQSGEGLFVLQLAADDLLCRQRAAARRRVQWDPSIEEKEGDEAGGTGS